MIPRTPEQTAACQILREVMARYWRDEVPYATVVAAVNAALQTGITAIEIARMHSRCHTEKEQRP